MAPNFALLDRAVSWIDERTGVRELLRRALDEPIPGGSRWVYVFGSALLATLVLQTVTGILLAFYYVPSVDHAHTTVAYIQKEVALGWLVRGVHYYGASAVIVVLLLHLSQVFLWGAYKRRREALWLVGVVLLNLLLGFGFTGYLLPWDQKAYFGTQVAGGIASSVPLVGGELSRVLLGGAGVGQGTLSRFFALHVFVLPALTVLLTVVHLYLFRYAGPAGPVGRPEPAPERTERFYPAQFFKDTLFAAAIAVAIAVAAGARPAPLGPEADPSVGFVPRPEWYFLWTFQLLKYLPAFVGGVVVPGLLMTALALAPFLDRSPSRSLRARLVPIATYLVVMAAIGVLTTVALVADARDAKIAQQEEAARRFMEEPFEPDRIGAPAAERPVAPPPAAYLSNCAGCHGPEGGGVVGPALRGVASRPGRSKDELVRLVADPRAFGIDPVMPAFPELPEEERRAIAEWIASLD